MGTGHSGFKGGWLSLWLQKLGVRVIGYSLPPLTEPSLFEATRVADGMTSVANVQSTVLDEFGPHVTALNGQFSQAGNAIEPPDRTGEGNPLQCHFDLKEALELPEAVMTDNTIVFGPLE